LTCNEPELAWAEIKKHYFLHNLINHWFIGKVILHLRIKLIIIDAKYLTHRASVEHGIPNLRNARNVVSHFKLQNMKSKFLLLSLSMLVLSLVSKASDSLLIISPKVKVIKSTNDYFLRYLIVSKAKKTIQLKVSFDVDDENNKFCDVAVGLEKKEFNKYIKIQSANNPPLQAYEGAHKLTNIFYNDTLGCDIDLEFLYGVLKAGQYRLRILLKASNYNSMNDVQSTWLYFTVYKDLKNESEN
jgi:hypothetical protein